MAANDVQVGGEHYKNGEVGRCPKCGCEIQHWDWAQSLRGLEYAATKYLARWRLKGGLESLRKVLHYTQKIIESNFPGVRVTIEVREDRMEAPKGAVGVAEPARGAAHPYQRIE